MSKSRDYESGLYIAGVWGPIHIWEAEGRRNSLPVAVFRSPFRHLCVPKNRSIKPSKEYETMTGFQRSLIEIRLVKIRRADVVKIQF